MNALLISLIAIPLATVGLIILLPKRGEVIISRIAFGSNTLSVLLSFWATFLWLYEGAKTQVIPLGYLYRSKHYQFPVSFFVDVNSISFLVTGAFISMVVVKFSRYYLHREEGFGRFFSTIFLFLTGINLLALAGTLDLFFAAWELIGISSFLLIGFYRERLQPVRNSLHAFAVYRVTDLGLFLGAFLSHVIFAGGVSFSALSTADIWGLLDANYAHFITLLAVLLVFSAMGKSAQFPFSFWLPKAMEGPTPSSAIFYGGLAVHAGVFLLIRTFEIWHESALAIGMVFSVGLVTAILATGCGRTQASIKGQIAYASIAQVGLMFVGLALGFKTWVLIHMIANIFLRSYQLLVSPSAVVQVLQFQSHPNHEVNVSDWSIERMLPNRFRTNLYVFSLNEAYLEAVLRRLLWRPLARFTNLTFGGKETASREVSREWRWVLDVILLFSLVIGCLYVMPSSPVGSAISMALALFCAFFALSERHSYWVVWNTIGLSSLFTAMTIFLIDHHLYVDGLIFLAGILPCWLIGSILIAKLPNYWSLGRKRNFMGLAQKQRGQAFWFLLCTLGMIGFPLFPTFLGEDLLLHAHTSGTLLPIVPVAFLFVLNGIVAVRTYAMLCLGPNRFVA